VIAALVIAGLVLFGLLTGGACGVTPDWLDPRAFVHPGPQV
jgi:hypothetical protein